MADNSDTTNPPADKNQQLIDRWVAAFVALAGHQPNRVPVYENGWVVFKYSHYTSRYRRAQFSEMAGRLEGELIARQALSLARGEPTEASDD
jgi:hypothetical protein